MKKLILTIVAALGMVAGLKRVQRVIHQQDIPPLTNRRPADRYRQPVPPPRGHELLFFVLPR